MMTRTLQAGKPLETRWTNAIRRAKKEGIEVWRIDGTDQWIATSHSDAGKVYVLVVKDGEVVNCSCPAKDWGGFPCKHAAALRLKLDPGFAAQLQRAAGQAEMFEGMA